VPAPFLPAPHHGYLQQHTPTIMKSFSNKKSIHKQGDIRVLLNDTWTLIEQLNESQLKDLIDAIDNVKTMMEYAISTGMKSDTVFAKSPLRSLTADQTVYHHFSDDRILHFSGKY
jgi:hypothetical protein